MGKMSVCQCLSVHTPGELENQNKLADSKPSVYLVAFDVML